MRKSLLSLSTLALASILLAVTPTSVVASNPGNLEIASNGTWLKTVSYATQGYSIASNFNNFPAIKFTSSTYPMTVQVTVQAFDSNNTQLDVSNYTCNFFNNGSWGSTLSNYTITRTAVSSNSITCEIVATRPGQAEFNVGTARTNNNFGIVRFWFPDPPQAQGSGSQRPNVAAPIKYSGPEFSGLSLKPVINGTGTTLEGRKLDQISSITIDGKSAKLSDATDKSLELELPAGLKPGVYDLVVNTANHGKLTHMNAIRIREELPATSLTIKGSGVLSGEEFKKLTVFSRTQNPDMNTVTCIVNSNSEGKSFMQARALCDRIAATNLNVKTTMFEARSTVEGSAVFARVVFSSEG